MRKWEGSSEREAEIGQTEGMEYEVHLEENTAGDGDCSCSLIHLVSDARFTSRRLFPSYTIAGYLKAMFPQT